MAGHSAQRNGARETSHQPKESAEETLRKGMKKLARREAQRLHSGKARPGAVDDTVTHRVKEQGTTVIAGPDLAEPVTLNGVGRALKASGAEGDAGEDDDEEEEDDGEEEREEEDHRAVGVEDVAAHQRNGDDGIDDSMQKPVATDLAGDVSDAAEVEPSFGELAAANSTEPIDVEAAFAVPLDHAQSVLTRLDQAVVPAPSAISLGTVLGQALRTNDIELLESCLQTRDVATVRATIQRLQSPLAAILLSRLAERMHRRPGRAGTMMIWIQWTLISHGGYLASQPELMRQLGALHDVLGQRARGLQPLLSLKGKLDMLDAQMQLRRSMQAPADHADSDDDDDDDGEAVIYVEGQDESADSDVDARDGGDDDLEMMDAFGRDDADEDDEEEGTEDEVMPNAVNGLAAESEGTEDESGPDQDDDDDDDLIDDEADEMDADTEEDDDGSDLDDGESLGQGDDAHDLAPPPPKRSALSPR